MDTDEDKIQQLEKKISHIEYEDIKDLKEDVNKIKVDLATNNVLIKQMTGSNNKLSDAIDAMKETMIEVKDSIKGTNMISKNLSNQVGALSGKVDSIEDKFDTYDDKLDCIDNKSKIDIMRWMRDLFLVLGTGFVTYLLSTYLR